jgi:hypothetical protein
MSLVVVTLNAGRSVDVHQYSLALPGSPAASEPPRPGPSFRDPRFRDSRFAAMRRIELMQRSV